jgi:hypothetical protein
MPQQIVSNHVSSALQYVFAVTQRGNRLTVQDLDAFAMTPQPSGPEVGTQIQQMVASIAGTIREIRPGAAVSRYLTGLRWISVVGEWVTLTPLGRSVLAISLDEPDSSTAVGVVVLDPSEPLSPSLAAEQFGDPKNDLWVDPYFGGTQLKSLLEIGIINRILSSTSKRGSLATSMASLNCENLEIRVISDGVLHDRLLTRTDGSAVAFGASFNGISNKLSVMIDLRPQVCVAYLAMVEGLWEVASKVNPLSIE